MARGSKGERERDSEYKGARELFALINSKLLLEERERVKEWGN